MDTITDDFLEHYGVKGMKWGVRRSKSQLARASKNSTKKTAKNLSDEELKKAVERLRLEREYVDITSKLSTAKTDKAKEFIGRYSQQAASVAVGAVASAVVKQVIDKKLGK